MKETRLIFILTVLFLFCCGAVLPDDSKSSLSPPRDRANGVPLTGQHMGKPDLDPGDAPNTVESLDGTVIPVPPPIMQDIPVLSEALAEKAADLSPEEMIRVIIFLKYQPHDLLGKQVRDRRAAALRAIADRVASVNSRFLKQRNKNYTRDADNSADGVIDLTPEERELLKTATEQHEALSLEMKNELVALLSTEMTDDQAGIRTAVEGLGGIVEYGTICVNALVALVPVSALDGIASLDHVARIAEDVLTEGNLTNADDATKVSDSGSFWPNGETGGIYDPAVLDCGTDLDHPGLEDSADRINFYSWYLVAGAGDPWWNDLISIDDCQGHGTHVMGIVASYGTPGYPEHLGMSYGVEKAVTLKAAWRGLDGRAYMYSSDAMWLVDRALYDTNSLVPFNSFNDDVDGINLSSGGETADDETDYSRFWDSVISSYSDMVVTFSAGNSGPSNTLFREPACNYNGITVANVDDNNTPERTDDEIWTTSTRGPTANGRRKPDIAAPGTDINSCNFAWESELDYIDKTGTSMAAPMILGIAMDLMDTGVYDEKAIKALLLNTAQKNETLIDFESDSDGWSEEYGWGYVNAWSAYYHRGDVFTNTVTARGNSGSYRLYKGQMRDEGTSGEGRDRATLVWNRHATYNPHDYPITYYTLSDLNLRLYTEDDGVLMDYDFASQDNVHQVRVDSGTSFSDTVVKVYAWSTSFDHGGSTEGFSLATEEDFVEVGLPTDFQAYGIWPSSMEPGEEAEFDFWLINDSEIASHDNTFDPEPPTGWSLISGPDPYDAGSIAGEGGSSSTATWTLKASSTLGTVAVPVEHNHESYAESYGPYNWLFHVTVEYDTDPPSPDPMTFAVDPYPTGTGNISMTATTASDLHEPVQYYFDYYSSPTGGSGGSNSGWQSSTDYSDGSLQANHEYSYRVKARDSSIGQNETSYSSIRYIYTHANTPGTPSVTNPTSSTLDVNVAPNGNPSWTEFAIWVEKSGGGASYYLNASGGSNGGTPVWRTDAAWGTVTATGLESGTTYLFSVKARNGDGVETDFSSAGSGTTTSASFTLAVTPDPMQGGMNATFNVTNGTPNTNTWLAYSLTGPGSTYISMLDVTLGLANPVQGAGPTMSNGSGAVTWTLPIPSVSGVNVWLQAVQYGQATNVVATSIQ